jgi:hypothetical protein
VRCLQNHAGAVTLRTGFEKVYERDGGSVWGEEPDTGPFHLQQSAAGFCDGLEGVGEIAAVQGFTLGQFPERLLILFQEHRCVLPE